MAMNDPQIGFQLRDGAYDRMIVFDNGQTFIDYICSYPHSDRLAISFASYSFNGDKAPTCALDQLLEQGYDVLAVRCWANDWYQDISREDMLSVMSKLQDYPIRLVIGADMGGYGALYFAEAVAATAALVFSPHFSADPLVADWDDRWDSQRVLFRHRPLEDVLDRTATPILALVEAPDRYSMHINRIVAAAPNCSITRFPYFGHFVSQTLDEMGLLSAFIAAVDGRSERPTKAAVRAARAQSWSYLKVLAETCIQHGHLAVSGDLLERAVALKRRPDVLIALRLPLREN